MIDESNFLKKLHMENSILLNKFLCNTSLIGIPIIIYFLVFSNVSNFLLKTSFFLALVFLVTSTILLLWSFFISEKAIEALENSDIDFSKRKNNLVKKVTKWASFFVLIALFSIIFGVYVLIF